MKAIFYPSVPFVSLALPFIYKEIYLDQIYRFLQGTHDLTILDIGANIGEVTRFIRPVAKKIYAIEPSPLEFEALKQNKEYNGWDNVEVFNLAIADKTGEMGFEITDGNRTGNHLSEKGKIRVPTKRLDEFMAVNKIDKVDFMKLDVEGAEREILKSDGFLSVRDKITSILIEFHQPWVSEMLAYMVGLGYKMHHMKTDADVYVFNR